MDSLPFEKKWARAYLENDWFRATVDDDFGIDEWIHTSMMDGVDEHTVVDWLVD